MADQNRSPFIAHDLKKPNNINTNFLARFLLLFGIRIRLELWLSRGSGHGAAIAFMPGMNRIHFWPLTPPILDWLSYPLRDKKFISDLPKGRWRERSVPCLKNATFHIRKDFKKPLRIWSLFIFTRYPLPREMHQHWLGRFISNQ